MPEALARIIVYVPLLLLGVSAHEAAHAWAAWRCGDGTAKGQGRLTLLPFVHLDLVGSFLIPALLLALRAPFLVAYAKPTPVDPAKLRQPRDLAWVALAGPAANLALALGFSALGWVLVKGLGLADGSLRTVLGAGVLCNAVLAGFNLLPLPGLDGLKACQALLPPGFSRALQRLDRYYLLLLVLAAWTQALHWAMVPALWLGKALVDLAGLGYPLL